MEIKLAIDYLVHLADECLLIARMDISPEMADMQDNLVDRMQVAVDYLMPMLPTSGVLHETEATQMKTHLSKFVFPEEVLDHANPSKRLNDLIQDLYLGSDNIRSGDVREKRPRCLEPTALLLDTHEQLTEITLTLRAHPLA